MTPQEWFMRGEVGMSSEALIRLLFRQRDPMRLGVAREHPYDPADLRRCRLALEATDTTGRISEAAVLSPTWDALVAAWDDLCKTMDDECPEWRGGGGGAAPKTYEKMCRIRDRVNKQSVGGSNA